VLDSWRRERQRGEEAKSPITLDATGRGHACLCRTV
jgi:hypothetical protein